MRDFERSDQTPTLASVLATIGNMPSDTPKIQVVDAISTAINSGGYNIDELNQEKPWGAYFRIDSDQAERFIQEFFPGLSIEDARLGIDGAELSPKILLVSPAQRLSWQYHDRRAERWHFLNAGQYNKSTTDDEGEVYEAAVGTVVQFARGERHRLVAKQEGFTVVAEIWQHTDPSRPSDEDDIVRLADDYSR